MTRHQRLMNTLAGKPVDRPPVCFYEINGYTQNPTDDSPFNIYTDPSWKPLLDLAREKADAIARVKLSQVVRPAADCPLGALTETTTWEEKGSQLTRTTIRAKDRTLTRLSRRDPDVNTIWTLEHLLKNTDDLKAYLELPLPAFEAEADPGPARTLDKAVCEGGIVALDAADPLCCAAELFAMEEYLIIAMTERDLFKKLLDRFKEIIVPMVEKAAAALPGRHWRVVGAEYASAPYLPPDLFKQYLVDYDRPVIEAIHRHNGFARIHSHGRLMGILDHIVDTGCMGLDPIEPPPQGDVELKYVRENYGDKLVLFGNIEARDIENLPTPRFEEKVKQAFDEGSSGQGRGFVLMPSACPYGRKLPDLALKNYEKMIECAESV